MTNENIDWDEMAAGTFVKWENVGESVSGVITGVRPGTDYNGNPCPVLDLTTEDGERILSCGQANLKAQIIALKPTAGNPIKVTFSSTEKAEKGVKKMFTIEYATLGTPVADASEPPF